MRIQKMMNKILFGKDWKYFYTGQQKLIDDQSENEARQIEKTLEKELIILNNNLHDNNQTR